MKKTSKIINILMIVAGIALIANGIRLFWALVSGSEIFNTISDFPFIMLFIGGPFGIFLAILGGKGLKNQEIHGRLWQRWKSKLLFIIIAVAIIVILNLE